VRADRQTVIRTISLKKTLLTIRPRIVTLQQMGFFGPNGKLLITLKLGQFEAWCVIRPHEVRSTRISRYQWRRMRLKSKSVGTRQASNRTR